VDYRNKVLPNDPLISIVSVSPPHKCHINFYKDENVSDIITVCAIA